MLSRSTKLTLEIVLTALGVLTVLFAVAAWRLSEGPISLTSLTPMLEKALSDSERFTVDVDDAVLAWGGWKRTLDIRVRGVTVIDKQGRVIASVPEAAINLSGRALLAGLVAPTRIDVIGAKLALVRTEDGALRLQDDGKKEPATEDKKEAEAEGGGQASLVAILIEDLSRPPDPDRVAGYLRQVNLLDAEVDIRDVRTGSVWRAPQAQFSATRDAAGVLAEMSLRVDLGGRISRLEATGQYQTANGTIDLVATIADFELETLGMVDPELTRLGALKVPFAGILNARMDTAGRLKALSFDLTGGAGRLIDKEFYPGGITVRQMRLRGRAPDGLDSVQIEQATVDFGGPRLQLSGRLDQLRSAPKVKANIVLTDVATNELRRLWPQGVARNPRAWITENLANGKVEEARWEIAISAPTPDFADIAVEKIDGRLRFSGVSVTYLAPMPPVRDVVGSATMNADRMDIAITGGGLGNLRVSESKIAITDFSAKDQIASIEVVVGGPLVETLRLADQKPLGFLAKIGMTPEDFSGDAATRLALKFPLLNNLKVEQLNVSAAAKANAVRMRNAVLGKDIEDGTLTLRLDDKGMDLAGQVTLVGSRGDVELARTFQTNAAIVSQTKAKIRLDSAQRAALGFDFRPYADGPVAIDLVMIEQRNKRSDVTLKLGLDGTALTLAALDWQKPAGTKAAAQMQLRLVEQKLREIAGVQVSADGLDLRGKAQLAADGKTLTRFDIDRALVGLTDVKGVIQRGGEGWAVDVSGPSFDFGAILRDKSPTSEDRPALAIKADIDRVYMSRAGALDRVGLEARRVGERWHTVRFRGETEKKGVAPNQVRVSLETVAARQTLEATADDGGALLKIFDVTPNFVGGTLKITGKTDNTLPAQPMAGKIEMSEFRVVKAPLLARVLSVALLTGIGDALRGEGINFSQLNGDYVFNDQVLEIKDGRASGSAIGITAKGKVDLGKDLIDVAGTLVPAYAVNSLLGRIPLVGDILVPERGGGLFAANYAVSGPIDDPKVSVNPLSTIAPGFLRGLFGIFDGPSKSPTGFDTRPEPGSTGPAR